MPSRIIRESAPTSESLDRLGRSSRAIQRFRELTSAVRLAAKKRGSAIRSSPERPNRMQQDAIDDRRIGLNRVVNRGS
jgi:hypothetical protein